MKNNKQYSAPETEVMEVNGGYLMDMPGTNGAPQPSNGAPLRNPAVD